MAPLGMSASAGCPPGSSGPQSSFFRSTIFALARSLAQIPHVEWNAVKGPLFSRCPIPPTEDTSEVWHLSEAGQDAVLALGIFLLESGGQCAEDIVPYFLGLERQLSRVTVQSPVNASESKFSFHKNDHFHYQ